MDLSQHSFNEENDCGNIESESSGYAKLLSANADLNKDNNNSSRVLAFKNKAPAPKDGYQNSLKGIYLLNIYIYIIYYS